MSKRITEKSEKTFAEAQKFIPGGVNSPVRAFGAVGGTPLFIKSGTGCYLNDIDGNAYVDYIGSWGPLILGHADPRIVKRIHAAVSNGTSYGAPTEQEVRLAQLIKEAMPSLEKIRMVNSGTEATMSAIRLARGFTKRDAVIKFDGCYHGHVDSLLIQAGSGATTLGTPTSPGVPQDFVKHTISLPYNDIDAVNDVCLKRGKEIACIIVEAVAGNMGVVLPQKNYLEGLREITKKYGIVLIFDEVMTGFRVAHGGVQSLYHITPDLTTLGKIIGGGLPVGAYGGKREIMDTISPMGAVYQAGTLSGNPVAMTAGIATLEILKDTTIYKGLEEKSHRLAVGMEKVCKDAKIPAYHTRIGSMLCTFFTDQPVTDYTTAKKCNTERYAKFFHGMLEKGFYFAPSQFEAIFVSTCHGEKEIDATIDAFKEVVKSF
ncbi:MAG: glutamate-1-semialdehyde-2,1-aminomutase [Candidatus Jettenia sp.]|uniref:Glutamate-1-semialdehyde 2,1-aminomutase n=1 Tax=Candidatus Jettenia caeni TaxID=247490 RepID=I3ILB3_9BACT|nr:glutamate-1-semialdehyde 2,1-aminomutase [Candidatus Jettenia sp. AMX1]MBC6927652.1 glutamate-1-semialdehyde-2,1-aminomutase [Candidatus Jettenia sp.]WKZ14347.1 MAG: glutamate-1-semialdehyde 2,1-aminomutase [Candidatus Jettenia caeni]KAA0250076.1 MAG: glutamate-1-semialdehyde-2,1-aminomutase [Candidatus Jettenia sp. AMX1]MCE7880159.1 glutamate-1-semialdehyde-2,1-aminomutase [Candidatus Jettenia sp. AMX1]MCQ3926599.1 glutamate-1-semialdehyde-2,1-aminomutase [Candidatus Jettenia sp.]